LRPFRLEFVSLDEMDAAMRRRFFAPLLSGLTFDDGYAT